MEQSTELLITGTRCSAYILRKQSAREDVEKDGNKRCCQVVVEEKGSKFFTNLCILHWHWTFMRLRLAYQLLGQPFRGQSSLMVRTHDKSIAC